MISVQDCKDIFEKKIPNKVLMQLVEYPDMFVGETIDKEKPDDYTGSMYAVLKETGEFVGYFPEDPDEYLDYIEDGNHVVYANKDPEAIDLIKKRMPAK